MRFGDGAWRMLPGVEPIFLRLIDEVVSEDRRAVVYASSQMTEQRWGAINCHNFHVHVTSPAENVLRIRVLHHALGRRPRGPNFELADAGEPLDAKTEDGVLVVKSGDLELRVGQKNLWQMSFVDARTGAVITESPFKALGLMNKDGELHTREQLTLRPGTNVYGLGERFAALVKNGQCVEMWNADCGTCSDKGYKDVPFFLTNRGWGVLVNSPARVGFEIGTEQVTRAQFSVPGEELDYCVVLGPTPKDVVRRYTALTGRPALPPAWSFGLWLTTSFLTDYDEETVGGFIQGMADRKLPLHVFHFDCFWMRAHHWCDFRWDTRFFPDPEGMLERLKQRGLHICVWINPYIAERSPLFAEGAAKGYLLMRPNGDVYQRSRWQAGMGLVDFTNPAACEWYQRELERLCEMGVDCFKTDFGEEIPTEVVYHDGSDPERMHNYYTFLYNRTVFELLEKVRGKGQAVVFARSATAGCQKFPVHWGGDCYGTYASMAESLRGGLSLGLCGFGFWSHDIGGFEDAAPAPIYKRWVAFGLLSSHSRLHGSTSYRVPWNYDEEAVAVLRAFTELKCSLMPYLMRTALEAHETGVPVMRALLLEFPDDPGSGFVELQYMLGPSLLVAPVFHDEEAEYYLPPGRWVHLQSGEAREGSRWYRERATFFDVPLYLRENHAVARGASRSEVDYDYAANVTLTAGMLDGKAPIAVELCDARGERGARFDCEQRGAEFKVVRRGGSGSYRVVLPWAASLEVVDGGAVVKGYDGPGACAEAHRDELVLRWIAF
ncbi:MAG TPA: alpha-xylosidase [Polyangiaceae bacterium]